MVNGSYHCKRCGSSNVVTQEQNDLDDGTNLNMIRDEQAFEEEVVFNELMEQFEGTLGKGTNVYQLYLLLRDGINRDNPQIKNYIKEISEMWGTSQTNVLKNLDKLRTRLKRYLEEQGFDIVDNRLI